ncbi:MAG: hypothetical protein ACTSR8_14550 [Promethearchaeota archaeon]
MKESSKAHFENEFSTSPVDILLRLVKNLPKFWLAKIGVNRIIKNFPTFKDEL